MRLLVLIAFAIAMWLVYWLISRGTEAFGIALPCLALAGELWLARAYDRRRGPLG